MSNATQIPKKLTFSKIYKSSSKISLQKKLKTSIRGLLILWACLVLAFVFMPLNGQNSQFTGTKASAKNTAATPAAIKVKKEQKNILDL